MICVCSLAGTAACKMCQNNPGSMGQPNNFVTGITTVTDAPQITYVSERTCHPVIAITDDGGYEYALCSECDGRIEPEDNYCPNCGARVDA